MWARLSQFVGKRPLVNGSIAAYSLVVGLGFLQGAYMGIENHCNWVNHRPRVTINSPQYDPIVNICRDCGVLGFNVLSGGFGSAAIVATAPISVPILLAFSDKEKSPANLTSHA
jgi:hypothetical protein